MYQKHMWYPRFTGPPLRTTLNFPLKYFPGIGVKLGDSVFCVVGVKDMFSPLVKDNHFFVVCVFVLGCLVL